MNDLEGILVVALEHAVAAPMASCKLADAGARVIKIERQEGDFARYYDDAAKGESAYFVWLNRGKESVCLDLRNKTDKSIFVNMLERADVFIQNLAPGAVDRLGFDYESVSKHNPRLVYCSISGYGANDKSGKKAYDLLVQGESGITSITRNADGGARVGISVCDISTGVTAYSLILQALLGREKTGKGRFLDVSLYHTASDWMNVPFMQFHHGGKTPKPGGVEHPSIAPYGMFACADDRQLILSIQNEREWQRFCKGVLEQENLAFDPRFSTNVKRVENRDAVDAMCSAFFTSVDFSKAAEILEASQIAYGQVSELADIAAHPATRLIDIKTPSGMVEMIAPIAADGDKKPVLGSVPALNAHGQAIRKEFTRNLPRN